MFSLCARWRVATGLTRQCATAMLHRTNAARGLSTSTAMFAPAGLCMQPVTDSWATFAGHRAASSGTQFEIKQNHNHWQCARGFASTAEMEEEMPTVAAVDTSEPQQPVFKKPTVDEFLAANPHMLPPGGALDDLDKVPAAAATGLKRYKPRTPGLRHRVDIDNSHLYKGKPVKILCSGLRKSGGRGKGGRISMRHRGGGFKRLYRHISFARSVTDQPGVVERIEYDPNRSANIALVRYEKPFALEYIIAPLNLQPDQTVIASRKAPQEAQIGNAMPMKWIPVGAQIHNIEYTAGRGGALCRSAGTYGTVMDKTSKVGFVMVQLASKEIRYLPENCMATIGRVSNPLYRLRKLGKAGRRRNMGFRPKVRGVAMNPIDHPHGGGEGKSSGGRPSVSKWGKPTKGGYKTRQRNKASDKYIMVKRGGVDAGPGFLLQLKEKRAGRK